MPVAVVHALPDLLLGFAGKAGKLGQYGLDGFGEQAVRQQAEGAVAGVVGEFVQAAVVDAEVDGHGGLAGLHQLFGFLAFELPAVGANGAGEVVF